MTRQQCLDILDLPAEATTEDIKRAYRQLAQVWHPDRFPNNPELQRKANAKLAIINEAYNALIEGRATPDVSQSSPNSNQSETVQPASNEPQTIYSDAQVRYCGEDPRLKAPSQWGPVIGRDGILAAVEITTDGITLVTFNSEGPDEAMWYAPPSLLAVEETDRRWVRSGCTVNWGNTPQNKLPPEIIQLDLVDPEGILPHCILLKLKFRNEYYARLFLKRIQSVATFHEAAVMLKPVAAPNAYLKTFGIYDFVWIVAFLQIFPYLVGLKPCHTLSPMTGAFWTSSTVSLMSFAILKLVAAFLEKR